METLYNDDCVNILGIKMVDTTINYYALAYSILMKAPIHKALAKFKIREHQDHTKQCRHIAYAEKVKELIVNQHMRKIDVQKKLNISRDILNAALKYANVPDRDYRKTRCI